MKNRTSRIVALLLACSMLFSLAACGAGGAAADAEEQGGSLSVSGDAWTKIPDDKVSTEKEDDVVEPDVELSTDDQTETETDTDDDEQVTTDDTDDQTETETETEDEQDTTGDTDTQTGTQVENTSGENNYVTLDNVSVPSPKGEYNQGVVLVKVKDHFDVSALGELKYSSASALYSGSKWYSVKLSDSVTAKEAVTYLANLGTFEGVDYDYVMTTGAEVESVDVSCNPHYDDHKHHHTHKIPEGWQYANENGKRPGGSSDVVIAVIDTGVDYNHLDLRNNIWVNTAEIAGNGIDDDGNGYIDDIYGWDCVGNDNDPMDDNGHGTHVAGIIAAENNEIGGVGIAYNCKIMVLKAGNSSGYFNNSDIAEAVQYAYMNGASVINMSFGGSFISIAVEEALENAYNSCVLVAAAGNDSACNDLACQTCDLRAVSYPAALPYVIGVMSVSHDGKTVSSFSNYDHNPYNSIEYEVFAVGESVPSCWPGNKYANLNGTSMAAPTVAGIAALLRSYYSDREMYSTKFIQSQIVNTGTLNPYNYLTKETDGAHSVTNIYEALTQLPKPEVNLYDYFIDDSTSINSANNGNGVIDAGETVHLFVSLHNRGGVASNVKVSIDTNRGEGMTDPYFTFTNPSITLSDIGTYSVREAGADQYFEIVVSSDCPNDYLVDFNIRFTYENGMDEKDDAVYSDDGKQKAQFNVSRGYCLPATITEDTTYTADRLYIVGQDVVIPEGVTVTFEAGCEIQFYDDREYYNSPIITVYGTLIFNGTKNQMINIAPNERHQAFVYGIQSYGTVVMKFVNVVNLRTVAHQNAKIDIYDSYMYENTDGSTSFGYIYINGRKRESSLNMGLFGTESTPGSTSLTRTYVEKYIYNSEHPRFDTVDECWISIKSGNNGQIYIKNLHNSTIVTREGGNHTTILRLSEVINCAFISASSNLKSLVHLEFLNAAQVSGNRFSTLYQQYAGQVIDGYYDSTGTPTVDVCGSLSDASLLWPYVVSVEMFNADGEPITTIGKEEIKVRVTFNRPMDTTKETYLTFGTIEPYADYKIEGSYVSETVWEGTYTLKAQIENGQNFLKVNNACAAEDQTKTVFGEYQLHEFTIDTTAAMSMNLQAVAKEEGIELTWNQDDYDTLLGYNIYRSEEKDGNYVKLNPTILLPTDESFLDENAEPGKTYWYTYTVVLSDFTESNPAGKVVATAMDTMSPSLYHTPVNQGYENNNLVISCIASDNIAISSVILYYRTVGAENWKSITMSKVNDKYSATIFGSDVTLAGIEYYIVATDGVNTVTKGSEETPYTVVVKAADSLLGMGDVDGNGTVTTKDALMLMQCINGDLLLSDDAFKRADLNGDGVLSSVEALRILQYINGKVNTLEM